MSRSPVTDTRPDMLNCAQVAQLFGVHPQVARQMARQGRLPAHQPDSGHGSSTGMKWWSGCVPIRRHVTT